MKLYRKYSKTASSTDTKQIEEVLDKIEKKLNIEIRAVLEMDDTEIRAVLKIDKLT